MKKWLIALALLVSPTSLVAQQLNTHTTSQTILSAGQYQWNEQSGTGRLRIRVNLATQMLYVTRNGQLVALSSISSGKPGKETPTGVFPILEKDEDHQSSIYDSAPMPFMERLTWDGVALHAGRLPGRPASHGCVRLPLAFAEILFSMTRTGDIVEIVDQEPTLELDL